MPSKKTTYNKLMTIVIKAALYRLDKAYALSKEEINLLTTYLYEIEHWTTFEFYLFANTTDLLDTKDIVFLGKFALANHLFYHAIKSNRDMLKLAILNLLFSLTERKDTGTLNYFMVELKKLLDYTDIFFDISLNFLEKLNRCVTQKQGSLEEVETYIDSLVILNNPSLLKSLRLRLERCLIVYENNLKDK